MSISALGQSPASARPLTRAVLLGVLSCLISVALAVPSRAAAGEAPRPSWWVGQEVVPTNLPPEHEGEAGREGQGNIIVTASNLGATSVNGAEADPVAITDKLPAGVTPTAITGQTKNGVQMKCSLATLQCTFAGVLYPYQRLAATIRVKVELPAGTVTRLSNQMTVEGGGALRAAARTQDLTISGAPTPFGIQAESYLLAPSNPDGEPETSAGAHPFQLTSTLAMNQTNELGAREPVALPRNLSFKLPLGLIGNPRATETCPSAQFTAHSPLSEVDQCPPGSVVGVAAVTIDEPAALHVVTLSLPLFNLVPSEGEPARFGFEALGLVPVVIDTAVEPGDDYDVTATVTNASQLAGLLSSQVTFWGVPGDARHNQARGWECINNGIHFEKGEVNTPCPTAPDLPQTPLLTSPTYCPTPAGEPVTSSVEAESWLERGDVTQQASVWSGVSQEALGFEGCQELPFAPALGASPGATSASAPSGMTVAVRVPQNTLLESEGRAEADVRDSTVSLPAGVQVSPSAANGLQACSEADIGFSGFREFQVSSPTATFSEGFDVTPPAEPEPGEYWCPDASKLGTVRVKDAAVAQGTGRCGVSGGTGAEWGTGEEPVQQLGGALPGS